MFKLSTRHRVKGQKAETAFRAWLNWSAVAYMYVEQSPFTVPAALKGRIKRPDYLVGLPHVGLLAFDVKAKSVYDGMLIFERDEVEKLALFARMFHVTLYFVCVGIEDTAHIWIALADLQARPLERRGRRQVLTFPVEAGFQVQLEQPFLDALFTMAAAASQG
ncbi:hypothetical protein [Mesorhizobium sp. M0478]|uniref:hypothetical protein n=1 Tax=Mesorhizobium sp. M0478 TaxID=2956947 RepID=UPI00333E0AA3